MKSFDVYEKTIQLFAGRREETIAVSPTLDLGPKSGFGPTLEKKVEGFPLCAINGFISIPEDAVVSYSSDPAIVPREGKSSIWVMEWYAEERIRSKLIKQTKRMGMVSVFTAVKRPNASETVAPIFSGAEGGTISAILSPHLPDAGSRRTMMRDFLFLPRSEAEELRLEEGEKVILMRDPLRSLELTV